MPGMRACDEEERTDRQGHATVEMPGLPAELDDAAARPQTGADAGGVPLMAAGASSQTASESTGDTRALRKRIVWCWSIRLRIAPPDAKRHTVMADGTYMGHGWRLIIAIDGESGEVLAFQWRAYEELRRCCRRLEKLFRAGDSSPFPGRRLPQVGRWRAPRTGWRAASTRSSRTCCATRGLPEEHMLRACEWVCYMKTAHPRPESFIPDDPLEDGKATSPEPEGDASPAYGIGIDWNEFHTGTRYPNGTD